MYLQIAENRREAMRWRDMERGAQVTRCAAEVALVWPAAG